MLKHRAQSTIEYAVFIGIVVAALIVMQVYLKRGIQGHLRGAAKKLTSESSSSYDQLKLNPGLLLEKIHNPIITEEDADFTQGKVLGNDFAYSPGATTSVTQIDTRIAEVSVAQEKTIETADVATKTTQKKEEILPFTDEPARW